MKKHVKKTPDVWSILLEAILRLWPIVVLEEMKDTRTLGFASGSWTRTQG